MQLKAKSSANKEMRDYVSKEVKAFKENHMDANGRVTAKALQDFLINLIPAIEYTSCDPSDVVIDLSRAIIVGNFQCPAAKYPKVNFSEVNFTGEAIFSSVIFEGGVVFSKSIADAGAIIFQNVRFERKADFSGCRLCLLFFFDSFLNCALVLDNAEIGGKFFRTIFGADAKFSSCKAGLHIKKCEFHGPVFFNDAELYWWNDSEIEADQTEKPVIFRDTVTFKNASFRMTSFSKTQFLGEVSFSAAIFNEGADFKECIFQKPCNFNNSKFLDSTDFSYCYFKVPPSFHDAILHGDTSFEATIFESQETERDWRAYRRLKQLMHEVNASHEEGRFFAYELRTSAKIELKRSKFSIAAYISKLYDWLSRYGQSIGLPIFWLFTVNIVFAIIFYYQEKLGNIKIDFASGWYKNAPGWIGLTLQNIFNPFAFLSKTPPYFVETIFLAVLCILQSVITILLFTLIILALRRRFRKGSE